MPKHLLQLTYQEFQAKKKSIAGCIIDKYVIYERIGQGAFGSVYRGMNDENKKQIAVKVLDLVSIEEDEKSARVREIRKRLAKTESEMMMKCDSPHVMKCYDVYENKDLKIMMIEYCNGGTLSDALAEKGRIPENEAIDFIKQAIFGIAEMHKHNIIHRDLKTQNIMFHNGILKIVDLGFSKVLPGTNSQSIDFGTTLGTIITMAPEVMKRQKYGLKADIWSIGIILYEMIYGKIPYEPMRAPDMYEQIINKNIFPNGGKIGGVKPSDRVLDFMKKILVIEQKYRMNWKEFLDHPALNQVEKQLPQNFRVSRNIAAIKNTINMQVGERTDDDICVKIEEEKPSEVQEGKEKKPIRWINQKEKKAKKEEMSRQDEKVTAWVKENHLECLKTEFIFKNIVLPIEQNKFLHLKERRNVEFLYLLVARCFFNMSFIHLEVNKNEHQLVTSLKERVNNLYLAVQEKFNQYCEILKKIEDGWGQRFKDGMSKIFHSDEMKNKDKFLVGVQLTDYKKQEQIQYTCKKYIKEILAKEEIKDKKIQRYLRQYGKINYITEDQLKHKSLHEKIKELTG